MSASHPIHATFLVTGHAEENGYGAAIAEALRATGHEAATRTLGGQHAPPDAQARADAEAAWGALEPTTVPVIDGLALAAFAGQADAIAARFAVALIHHPMPFAGDDAAREARRQVEAALLPRFARVVATSPIAAERLAAEFGVEPARVATIEPGIPDARRSTGSGSGSGGCAILSVGTLAPRKGHDVLLRALARLFDLGWTLTVVGATRDPAVAAELSHLAQALGVADRVTFAGTPDTAEMAALWDRSDLFALATRWEITGAAAGLALRHGLPVAIGSGGAAAACISPECGVACPPGDVDQLSKSLRRLIFDTGLRRDMADAAWTRGRTLPDWPKQAALFAQVLAH